MEQQQQQQVNIRPEDTELVLCKCGESIFEQVFMIRKLSALISPTGKEEQFQIPLILCRVCGEPLEGEDEEPSAIVGV